MVILDRVRQMQSACRNRLHQFLVHKGKTLEGALGIALVMRFVLLMGLILRFTIDREDYLGSPLWAAVQFSLAAFCVYVLLLICLRVLKSPLFLSGLGKLLQVSIDIVAFSIFYFLTKDAQSEIYLAYFLPLLVAAHCLRSRHTLVFLLFTTVAFGTTLLGIATLFEPYPVLMFLRMFLPREFLLATVTLTYWFCKTQLQALTIEERSSLDRVSQTIISTLELNEVLSSIMEQATKLLKAETGSVLLLDDKSGELVFEAAVGTAADSTKGVRFPSMLGIAGWVLREHQPQLVSDVSQDHRFYPEIDSVTGLVTKSLLCVPLEVRGEVIGVLEVMNKARGSFNEDDLRLLTYIAPSAAIAIENARLYTRVERQAERLTVLHKIGREITSALELDRILDSIAEHIVRLVEAKRSLFLLVDKERGCLTKSAGRGYPPEHLQRLTFEEIEAGVSGCVLRTGKPALVADAQSDPRNTGIALERAKQFGTAPLIVTPLMVKGEVVGTLTAANTAGDPPFTEDDLNMVIMLANQAAIAIENARLFRETKRRLEEMAALHQTSLDITAQLEMPKLLRSMVERAAILLEAEAGGIFLYDSERVELRLAISYGYTEKYVGITLKPGEGMAGKVFQSGEPMIVDNYRTWEGRSTAFGDDPPFTAVLEVPLKWRDRISGVLVINGDARRGTFNQADVWLATLFANQAAVAIENARIYEDERKRATQLELISGITQKTASILDLNELLSQVVHLVGETFGYYYTGILLIESGSDELVMKAVSGPFETQTGRLRLKIGPEGISGWVAHTGEPLLVNDVSREPRYYSIEESKDTRSELAVPIKLKAEVIGVLDVQSVELDAFSQDDISILQTLADQLAIAIGNARLYEAEQERRHIAETLRQASTILSATLELDEVLGLILQQLRQVIPYDSVSVQRLQGERLEIVACRGFEEPDKVVGLVFPLDLKFPNYRVVMKKAPLAIEDVVQDYPHFQDEADSYESGHIRSWLGVPLMMKDQVIGMIALDRTEVRPYTAEETQLAMAFANQAAVAIENVRLFQETQQRVQELTTLQQVSVKLTAAVSKSKDLLKTIVDSAVSTIPTAERGIVHLVDPARQELCPEVWSGIDSAAIGMTKMKVGEGVAGYAIAAGALVNVPDTSLDGRFQLHPQSNGRCKSLLVAPMLIGKEKIGTISVDSTKANAFNPNDERLLTALATHAAYAIQNARLLNQTMAYAATLEKLAESSKKLIGYTELDELFTFAAQQGTQIFSAEDCSLFVKNKLKQKTRMVASSRVPLDIFPEKEAPISSEPGAGLTQFVAATGQILSFVGDTYKEHPAWKGEFRDHLKYLPSGACHSLLIGPLEGSEGEIVGVVKLENKSGEDVASGFSEFEEKMFRTFASQVGIAIERAQLFQRIDELARKSERERLREDLHDAMNLVHALIMLEAERILELVQAREYQKAETSLRALWKNARFVNFDQLGRLLEDMRDPTLADKGLAVALQNYVGRIKAFEVHLDIQGRGRLPFKTEHILYRIAQQALGNVAKHARLNKVENGKAQVTLIIESESVTLTIADNGVGFDAEKELERRDALGLSVMRRWARSIDAQFEIISRPGKGTTVRIVVPWEKEKEM